MACFLYAFRAAALFLLATLRDRYFSRLRLRGAEGLFFTILVVGCLSHHLAGRHCYAPKMEGYLSLSE